MNTAVKISWSVLGSTFSETFDEHEIAATPVAPDADDIIKTLHTGKPSRVSRTGKNRLAITFILHATGQESISTLSVYYKYIADPTAYLDCVLPKGQIPDELVIAGMNSGRREITVEFYEV